MRLSVSQNKRQEERQEEEEQEVDVTRLELEQGLGGFITDGDTLVQVQEDRKQGETDPEDPGQAQKAGEASPAERRPPVEAVFFVQHKTNKKASQLILLVRASTLRMPASPARA